MISSSRLYNRSTSTDVKAPLSALNDYQYSLFYLKVCLFRLRSVSSLAILEYPQINFRQQFPSPRKDYTSFTNYGIGQLIILSTFPSSIAISPSRKIYPRNPVSRTLNSYFLSLSQSFYSISLNKTFLTCLTQSSLSSKNIIISSRYTV